eukprot:UN04249
MMTMMIVVMVIFIILCSLYGGFYCNKTKANVTFSSTKNIKSLYVYL